VTRGELSDLAGTCGGQLGAIQKQCRAGTICGACAPLVSELVGAPAAATKVPYSRLTGWASTLLFACVLVFVMAPSVPVAASVRQVKFAFEALWRSSLFRQVTGYTIVALFLVGLLLSARKRLSWFRWGSFGGYRALHTCLGLASVVALCVHTGLRFGSHLNFALMTVFVGAALTGAVAGVSAALEGGPRSHRARVARGLMSRLHIWMLWPLPALLAFHILAAYYF
jgi:nitrite reductase (NADH) large subunit